MQTVHRVVFDGGVRDTLPARRGIRSSSTCGVYTSLGGVFLRILQGIGAILREGVRHTNAVDAVDSATTVRFVLYTRHCQFINLVTIIPVTRTLAAVDGTTTQELILATRRMAEGTRPLVDGPALQLAQARPRSLPKLVQLRLIAASGSNRVE